MRFMNFAELIAPVPVPTFLETYDKAPLHIPASGAAGERRRALMPWGALNAMLGIAGQWGEENVKLILGGVPVGDDYYLDSVATRAGMKRRANPQRSRRCSPWEPVWSPMQRRMLRST